MNAFANTPESFHRFFKEKGLQSAILYPGETYQSGLAHDNAATLKKFEEIYNKKSELVFDKPKTVELNLIFKAFDKLIHQLYEKYPRFLLRRLKPVSVHIPDLNKSVAFSIRSKSIAEIEGSACDLTIGSQAFYLLLIMRKFISSPSIFLSVACAPGFGLGERAYFPSLYPS